MLMAHDGMGMINGTAGADLTGTEIKGQTDLIPRPRPSTETLVTLCWKGAQVVAAVAAVRGGGVLQMRVGSVVGEDGRCFHPDAADSVL